MSGEKGPGGETAVLERPDSGTEQYRAPTLQDLEDLLLDTQTGVEYDKRNADYFNQRLTRDGLTNIDVTVHRTSGEIEEQGWTIESFETQEETDNAPRGVIVNVIKPVDDGVLYKRVPLAELRAWQKKPEAPGPDIISDEPVQQLEEPHHGRHRESEQRYDDEDLRFEDGELLGKSYRIRRKVGELGNQRTHAWESLKARSHNALDTPGKVMRQGLYNRANNKVQELEQSHQSAREAALQAGGSQLLVNKRLARIDRKFNRKKAKWNNKRNAHKAKLDTRVNRMTKRTESVSKKHESQQKELIAELKARKEQALARRSLRRELRSEGTSWRETYAIMKDIPAEQRKKIGEAALLAQISQKTAKETRKFANDAEFKADKLQDTITANFEKSRKLANKAKEANDAYNDIQDNVLPGLKAELEEAKKADPSDTMAQVRIIELEQRIDVLENRELPYWQDQAEKHRRQVVALTEQNELIRGRYTFAQDRVGSHFKNADKKAAAAKELEDRHQQAIHQVVNPNTPERNE